MKLKNTQEQIIFESDVTTMKKLVELAVNEKINLRNANLRNADLRNANLRNADLRNANLQDANLQGANLQGANLQGANLQGANLQGANLQGANLQDADLRYADLRYADLQDADLQDADLRNADLRNADLRNADLDFSSGIPYHCGGTKIKVDDRIISQMLFHLTRQNTDGCSGGVKEAIEAIKKMAVSDLFCEYRSDVEVL